MFFGDIVTITPNGVLARKKALRPLGIYDQSICWGMWVADPHPHPSPPNYNLVISPFHPSSWPFLVRLRLVLENRKGALAEASKLLEEHDLSIVFAECILTGFSHVTWAVIAESTREEMNKVRKDKEEFDWNHSAVRVPSSDSYRGARKIANSIAAHMLTHIRQLEGVFEQAAGERQESAAGAPKLFHRRNPAGDGNFIYDSEEVAEEMAGLEPGTTPEDNLRYIGLRISAPHEVGYMYRLAYYSIYGGGRRDEVPFRFQYHANATLIEVTEQDEPFVKGSFALNPLPMPAIAAFNSEEKFLRLFPVTPGFLNRPLARIDLDYEVRQTKHNAKASQGLLRRACDELKGDVNLLHVWNKCTKHHYHHEEGQVTFIADADPDEYRNVAKRLKGLNDVGKEGRLQDVSIRDAHVYKYPVKKIFLSIHFGHPREECIRKLVKRAALAEGFMDVTVRTYTTLVTREVDAQLGDSDALLQLLYSDVDPSVVALPPWLQHEYSTALARDKPTFRLVDISKFGLDKWKTFHVINPDQAVRPFRLDVSDDDLYKVIREAVGELAKKTGGAPER